MSVLRKHTIVLILLTVLISMTVGGALSSTLMIEDGNMHNCPYMGVVALCDMTPLGHLSEWQSMFAVTAQQLSVLALLLLLALLIASRFVKDILTLIQSPPRAVSRYGYGENMFDPLRLAIASGIIHPKIF